MCINWWVDKQNMVHLYSGRVFGHEKEWSSDTWYNTDEPGKHTAKWKKPDTNPQILHDSIYTKYPQKANI